MQSRVIVLAGPSGAGKSRLAERLGLPVLRLDDFYKSGGDPTLPRKTRSFITLAMMIALNREEEFKLHVRPALAHGVSLDELRALTIQAGVYGGVPAANAAFRWLRAYLLRRGFLDGPQGWRIAWFSAREVALKYRLLRELNRTRSPIDARGG